MRATNKTKPKMNLQPKQTRERCPKCKFRIRGLNHNTGTHHNKPRKG